MRRRRGIVALLVLTVAAVIAVLLIPNGNSTRASKTAKGDPASTKPGPANKASTTTTTTTTPATAGRLCPCPYLAPGSDPSVLPGPVLIADHLNNRLLIVDPNGTIAWSFPQPGDLAPGETFLVPDDAFFTPDGKYIVVTEEDNFVISLVSIAQHKVVWRYGTPGQSGSGPNHLWNPDDAMMMPDGNIIAADIKNCRLLVLRPGMQTPLHVYGTTTSDCYHSPPTHWGSPNGAFPMTDGNYLTTEINGDWVNELTLGGQIAWSVHPPAINYPSDTNEIRPGVFLTVDYSSPGQILEFDQSGKTLWRYATGLDHPSLALPLPNGDILCNDDYNHRVIVVDPRTNRIVWQYGHTGVHGTAPGYLYEPDGVDLYPPHSMTITHGPTMGEYPAPPGAPPAPGQATPAPGQPSSGH